MAARKKANKATMTVLALVAVVGLCAGIVLWRQLGKVTFHPVDVERWR